MKDNTIKPMQLLKELLKPYKGLLLKGFASLLIVNMADIIPPICLKLAIDSFNNPETARPTLFYCSITIIFIAILQSVFRFYWRQFFQGTSQHAIYDLRKQLFDHLLKLPFDYFKRTRTGDIMSRMTNDIQEIKFMLGMGILIFLDALFYLSTVPFIMIYLSPKLTAATLIPFTLITVFATLAKTVIHKRSREIQSRLSDLSSRAEENLSGIRVIKGFGTEQEEINRFDACGKEFVKVKLKLADFEAFFHPAINLLVGIGMILLLYIGGNMVIEKTVTLGVFMAFQGYMLKLNWPMRAIGMIISSYQRGKASLERCILILKEEKENTGESEHTGFAPRNFDLEAINASYKYPDGNEEAVKNISFKLLQGETLGITGPVGCGKTTLLRLIMKIQNLTSGKILVGGADIARVNTERLRNIFSYVPQEVFLFSESVKENILFSAENKNDPEQALAYAALAGLKGELEKFPHGIETMLGERGVNLSGGQKQRISIARALQAQRPILVLDDCTSAVDTETEKEILDSLNKNGKKTKIIVSHRMVSIQNADRIIYMDNGEIVEMGKHDELMKLNGRYAAAWQRQRLKEKLETK